MKDKKPSGMIEVALIGCVLVVLAPVVLVVWIAVVPVRQELDETFRMKCQTSGGHIATDQRGMMLCIERD